MWKNNKFKIKSKEEMLPLKLFIVYIICTFLIHIFGPWEFKNYETVDKLKVSFFILIFLIISSCAYFFGINKKSKKTCEKSDRLDNDTEINLLKISVVISMIIYMLLIFEGFLSYQWTLSDLVNLKETISLAYHRSQSGGSVRGIPLTLYIIGYFFCNFAMVIGLYRFKKISKLLKSGVVAVFSLAIIYNSLIIGSNKAFGDIIIIGLSVFILSFSKAKIKLDLKKILIIFSIGVVILSGFGSLFLSRFSLWGDVQTLFEGQRVLNLDNWMINFFSRDMAISIGLVMYYISHGYYGLSLTLRLPFVWTKGLGSSFAIKKVVVKLFSLDANNLALTYPERMEISTGWNAYSNWHTIFPWLASDFTFLGSIIVVSFFIYIYAIAWSESLKDSKWSSVLMFALLNQMILYIPANNQIFQTTTMTILFVITFVLWCMRDGKYMEMFSNNINKSCSSLVKKVRND